MNTLQQNISELKQIYTKHNKYSKNQKRAEEVLEGIIDNASHLVDTQDEFLENISYEVESLTLDNQMFMYNYWVTESDRTYHNTLETLKDLIHDYAHELNIVVED